MLDLEDAKKLVDVANQKKVKLAVNQNGRWAPHFSYIRNAVRQGLIGEVTSIDFSAMGSNLDKGHSIVRENGTPAPL